MQIWRKQEDRGQPAWFVSLDASGIHLKQAGDGTPCRSEQLSGFVAQLVDDGYANSGADGVCLKWDDFYKAIADHDGDYGDVPELLGLPPVTLSKPTLESDLALSDAEFSIAIRGWVSLGRRMSYPDECGAVLSWGDEQALMRAEQWSLRKMVDAFAKRGQNRRTSRENKLGWGRIRQQALKAGANLDNFLTSSVVLTPETLQLKLRKSHVVTNDTVVEVEPGFEGAPEGWLDEFDKWPEVRDEYGLLTEQGIIQVLVKPEVKTVLREIKRMPGRRMAGARAQAFVLNPFSVLGEDAQQVIDEQEFTEAQKQAGLTYERFTPDIQRDDNRKITNVALLIESVTSKQEAQSEYRQLSMGDLERFVNDLRSALKRGHSLLAWEGHDLEVSGEAASHAERLERVLEEWRAPQQLLSWDDIYDLGRYSDRIKGIGTPETYYSPYIVKKDSERGWFPDNLRYCIGYKVSDDEHQLLHVGQEEIDDLQERLRNARNSGTREITAPWLPEPMPADEAERVLGAFADDPPPEPPAARGSGESDRPETDAPAPPSKTTLLIFANIEHLDYEQRRLELEAYAEQESRLPVGLRTQCVLYEHQAHGLAWLQNLYGCRPSLNVTGAVLADDMGLGKTLQLLAFMAELVEAKPTIDPVLVVAPVALLQNWQDEVERFFEPGILPLLVAYGKGLKPLKVPQGSIDRRLRDEAGLVDFLKPGWVGQAKLVLTTYETLRNLEFSFAAQPWSVMVCDEAQKIKNPAAMVTRAAKKQTARFKVACTGTPVENTLADLWCLFDFVQPGLLGALDEFGKRYRKPIEAGTDEDKTRVEELRTRIDPQILRRTKEEVAKDLPNEIVDGTCRSLPLSEKQRNLYVKAVYDFGRRDEPDAYVPFKNHLGLLHYLRLICTDPRRYGSVPTLDEPLVDYRKHAPKMNWLIKQLEVIREHDEKVIIFCEFRGIQRLLKHYVQSALGVDADIINGTTSSDTDRKDSRQRRIDAFQSASGFGVIILSPMAVGFGLNIQAANHVVHYTRTWNPAKEDQATDRAYRIGQKRDVHVYYPVTVAEDFTTFDEQLDQLLESKRELARDMLNGSGDIGAGEFEVGKDVPTGAGVDINPRITIEATNELSGRYFEALVAVLWKKQSADIVVLTPSSGDYGVDVVTVSGSEGLLIQTKVSADSEGRRLGWDAVQEVVAGEAYYKNEYPSVAFKKLCVTNQKFNANAHEQAKLHHVQLFERRKLGKLLGKYPVKQSEIDAELYA